MQQASYEVGFEAEDIPLMIEAIPLNADCIVLIITKVEDPEELDTIGFYEYTEDQMALVEWADKFPEEMPEEALWIYIDKTDDRTRTFRIESSTLSRDELVAIGGSYVVGN